jgi:5S rRNA maturation endonuclease (ribonuclease M5)
MWKNLLESLEEGEQEVVVEGKRDRVALQNLGIRNRITLINQSPDRVAERVASHGASEAVVLTDFDRSGEELAQRICEALESYGVKPDLDIRRKLRYLFGVLFIEELDRKVAEFQEKLERFER